MTTEHKSQQEVYNAQYREDLKRYEWLVSRIARIRVRRERERLVRLAERKRLRLTRWRRRCRLELKAARMGIAAKPIRYFESRMTRGN